MAAHVPAVRLLLRAVLALLALLAGLVVLQWATAGEARAHPGHDHGQHVHCVALEGVPRLCSHGPDRAPAGVVPGRNPTRQQLEQRAATASYDPQASYTASALPSVACIGNGRSGPRVQAVYARPKGTPDRFKKVAPLIRKYAANADSYVNRSAAQKRSGRRIRFVTEKCKVEILKVTLSPRGDDSFNDTVRQMARKGHNRPNRKYLIWMDSNVLCGVGSIQPDDRRSVDNANNVITGFARVDRSCWGGGVEAHELFHTLGAVQPSAPHSTPAGHCYDENDAMCYLDGTVSKMRNICKGAGEWQIDCNHDDYFNPRPKAGSYLATHWNTANSRYLEPTIAPPTAPKVELPIAARRLPGLRWALKATSRASGSRSIAKWLWQAKTLGGQKHPTCSFSGATTSSPGFWCTATTYAAPQIVVTVWDNKGASNVRAINLAFAKPATPRATTLAVSATPATLPQSGGTVTLTATLKDTETGLPIIGMPLQATASDLVAWSYTTLASGSTSTGGTRTWSHSISSTAEYTVASASTPTWRGRTLARTVTVPLPKVTITASGPAVFNIPGYPTITGTALPLEPTTWDRQVELQSAPTASGPWTWVASTNVGSTGAYTFSSSSGWFYLDTAGLRYYRVHKYAGTYAAASSPVFTIDGRKTAVTLAVSAPPPSVPWSHGWTDVAFTASTLEGVSVAVQRCTGTCSTAGAWSTDTTSYASSWDGSGTASIAAPASPGLYSYRLVVASSDPYFTSPPTDPFTIDWTP